MSSGSKLSNVNVSCKLTTKSFYQSFVLSDIDFFGLKFRIWLGKKKRRTGTKHNANCLGVKQVSLMDSKSEARDLEENTKLPLFNNFAQG